MQRKIQLSMVCLLCALVLLGCGPISGLDVGRDGATVDIVLEEQQVDRVLRRANMVVGNDNKSLLDSITNVDFQDGHVVVEGTYTDESGATQNGRFDIAMSATDGVLNVQLTNVDIANVDPTILEAANRELAAEFAAEAQRGEVEFLDVTISDTELMMSIRVNF